MLSIVQKSRVLNFFLSLYFLFFYGWLQFHHGHDASDYLNLDDTACRVIVVGAHCHSSNADFPLFENHRIVIKPKFSCLFCTFNNWFFLRSSDNEAVCILTVNKLGRILPELISHRNASISYRLRAPPVLFPAS